MLTGLKATYSLSPRTKLFGFGPEAPYVEFVGEPGLPYLWRAISDFGEVEPKRNRGRHRSARHASGSSSREINHVRSIIRARQRRRVAGIKMTYCRRRLSRSSPRLLPKTRCCGDVIQEDSPFATPGMVEPEIFAFHRERRENLHLSCTIAAYGIIRSAGCFLPRNRDFSAYRVSFPRHFRRGSSEHLRP